jgi:hypothetical protein
MGSLHWNGRWCSGITTSRGVLLGLYFCATLLLCAFHRNFSYTYLVAEKRTARLYSSGEAKREGSGLDCDEHGEKGVYILDSL